MALNRITYTWGEEEMEGQQIKIKSHEDAAFSTRPMGKEASQQTLAAPGAGLAEVGCRCLLPLACCGGTGPTFPTRPLESPTPQESGPPSGEHSPVLALGPVLSAAPEPDGGSQMEGKARERWDAAAWQSLLVFSFFTQLTQMSLHG